MFSSQDLKNLRDVGVVKQLQDDFGDMLSKYKDLVEENDTQHYQISLLKEELKEKELVEKKNFALQDKLKTVQTTYETKINKLEEEKLELQRQISTMKNEYQEKALEIQKKENSIETKLSEYNIVQQDRILLANKTTALQKQVQQLGLENEGLVDALEKSSTQLEKLTLKVQDSEELNERLIRQHLTTQEKSFIEFFNLPVTEIPFENAYYSCSSGYLYLTQNYTCWSVSFFSSFVINEDKITIPLEDIVSVNKIGATIPGKGTSIEIILLDGKNYNFSGILKRQEYVSKLVELALPHKIIVLRKGLKEEIK